MRLTGYVCTVLMHVDENVIMRTFLEVNRLCRYSLTHVDENVIMSTFLEANSVM